LAKLTPAAVSMALRNHPRISEKTRQRVRELARRHGYRPDPEITKLMRHLRAQRSKRLQATICALTDNATDETYAANMLAAARARAAASGFALDVLRFDSPGNPGADPRQGARLERILLSRGIEGLLLLPMSGAVALDGLLDWGKFAVVAATYSVSAPQFHRVVPNHFGNLVMACAELTRRHYLRLGVVLPEAYDARVRHYFNAAITWHNSQAGANAIPPLTHGADDAGNLARWLKQHRPQAVICHYTTPIQAAARAAGMTLPRAFPVVNFHAPQKKIFAGIDEKETRIGETAVDMLSGMILRGEKGLPQTPTVTMLEGGWIDSPSLRPRPARARAEK